MRVLIIGGTGFIGRQVVKSLVDQGHQPFVLHRGKTEASLPEGAEPLMGDRQELDKISGRIREISPEAVIDMIPKTANDVWSVLRVIDGLASRFVVVSSIDVYRAYNRLRKTEPGEPDAVPLGEDDALRDQLYPYRENAVDALSPAYQYDKIIVERLALGEPRLPATVLRLPVVYGPRDGQNRIFEYLKRMDDGREAIVLGKQQSQWKVSRGYVQDVGAAVARTVSDTSSENRIYNVGEKEALTEREWVEQLGRAAGWKGEIVTVDDQSLPKHLKLDFEFKQDLVIDTNRLHHEVGYEQSDRHEALKATVDWQRDNQPSIDDPSKFDYSEEDRVLKSLAGLTSASSNR